MMLIKNGRVIDPASGLDDIMDLIIQDGKIEKIGKYKISDAYETVLHADGWIIAPGLVDIHVHFRDPGFTYKEDLESGAKSAAAGGFTRVVCMANTKPIMDNVDLLKETMQRAETLPINVMFAGAISKNFEGKELVDMEFMQKAGAVCFTDDGLPLKDEKFVEQVMLEAKQLQTVLSFHEEDPAYVKQAGINHGEVASQLGFYGADRMAEIIMVKRDIELAKKTGAAINIQHISSKEAVDLIRQAKKDGVDISGEASPHHFTLTEAAVLKHGTLAKMNPPLRTAEDRMAIIEGLKDNTLEIIATDHAPHAMEEKQREFTKAPSGIIGLETALSLGITSLVRKGHLTMMQLMDKMSYQPAMRIGYEYAQIKEGYPADFVIFDDHEKWQVNEFVSKASNSPFLKESLYGKVKITMCNGNIVYKDEGIDSLFESNT